MSKAFYCNHRKSESQEFSLHLPNLSFGINESSQKASIASNSIDVDETLHKQQNIIDKQQNTIDKQHNTMDKLSEKIERLEKITQLAPNNMDRPASSPTN